MKQACYTVFWPLILSYGRLSGTWLQRSSNEVPEIPFVEVECAKAGGFCNQFFPANGFPRVHMISKGGAKSHKYQGYTYQKITAFAKDQSKWELTHDTNLPGAAKAEL